MAFCLTTRHDAIACGISRKTNGMFYRSFLNAKLRDRSYILDFEDYENWDAPECLSSENEADGWDYEQWGVRR